MVPSGMFQDLLCSFNTTVSFYVYCFVFPQSSGFSKDRKKVAADTCIWVSDARRDSVTLLSKESLETNMLHSTPGGQVRERECSSFHAAGSQLWSVQRQLLPSSKAMSLRGPKAYCHFSSASLHTMSQCVKRPRWVALLRAA